MDVQIITLVVNIFTLLAFMAQLYFIKLGLDKDHKRRKQQSTLEYVSVVREKWKHLINDLKEPRNDDLLPLNPHNLTHNFFITTKSTLAVIEHLAVGVNNDIFDITIIEKMSGTFFIENYDYLKDFIDWRREVRNNPRLFCEFEEMVNKIKEIRK